MSIEVEDGISESEAVCRRLASLGRVVLPVSGGALSIAVDSGGGSTDIAFWSEEKLLDQVSFKLGGNDIFSVELCSLPGFVDLLYRSCRGQNPDDPIRRAFEARPYIMANWVLSDVQTSSLDPRLHPFVVELFKGAFGAFPWCQVRSLIFLYYAGLIFYLGLHARKFNVQLNNFQIYLGGRAASLLAWVNNVPLILEPTLKDAFLKGYNAETASAAGQQKIPVTFHGPSLHYNPQLPPKTEVAAGLLCSPLREKIVWNTETTLVGETGYAIDSRNLEWHDVVSANDLYSLRLPSNFESTYIGNFINLVLPSLTSDLSLDETNFRRLSVDDAYLHHVLRRATGEQQKFLQPIFASELAAVMNKYLGLCSTRASKAGAEEG
jgi:hypothetical protein